MRWNFWKKEEVKEKKTCLVRLIPDEHVREVRRLSDNIYLQPKGARREAIHLLWLYVSRLLPETSKGLWSLDFSDPLVVMVREEVDNE